MTVSEKSGVSLSITVDYLRPGQVTKLDCKASCYGLHNF